MIITEKGVESSDLLTGESILKIFGLYVVLTFIRNGLLSVFAILCCGKSDMELI